MEEYSTRQNKIAKLLQREMAGILLQVNRTNFSGKLISVSIVRITKDLGIARFYLSIFPSDFAEEILKFLRVNSKQLRGELGRKVGKSMRVTPDLEFYLDDSLDYIENIDKLLEK